MKSNLELAKLAQLAYSQIDGEAAEIEYIYREGVHAMRGTSRDLGDQGWRGLLADIQTDRKILPRNDPQIGMHPRGFTDAAKQMYQEVRTYPEPFVLTGHSLGAAVAVLTGAYLIYSGADVQQIVVFGCPRLGRFTGIDLSMVSMLRYRSDIVSVVPLGWSKARPVRRLGKRRWHLSWKDHAIENYIEHLEKGNE